MSLKVNLWRKEYMEYVALKDVCKINMGQSPDSSSYNDKKEGIPFYQGNADFGEKHPIPRVWCNAPTKIAQPKDILMSVRAPIGALNYAQEKCCIGRGLAAITPDKDKLSLEFLYWFLRGKNSELNSKGTGSTFKAISKKTLEEVRVPLIDLEKQQKMAQALEKTYSVIQMRTKQLKELDDLIKARFVEMFGDPVSNPYKLPVVLLGELSELITKGASPSWQGFNYTDDPSQTLFLTSENVKNGYIDLSSPKYIEDKFNTKQKRSIVHKGDFLINIVGASIGRAAQFNLNCKANMNQAAALVRINDNRIRDKYLLTYLNSDKAQLMYDSMKSDTGRANLSLKDISELSILLPSIEEQLTFEKVVAQIDKSKATVQKALDETQLLFDSLMQLYFG